MRRGFYTQENMGIKVKRAGLSECARCKLNKGCLCPCMQPTGEGRKRILVVAEAPGEREDEQGIQLVGEAGQLLRKELQSHGIDLDRDCIKTNAVTCRPVKNRTPTATEIQACRPNVLKCIREYKPHVILLFGGVAIQSVIGSVWKKDNKFGVGTWRGFRIPDQHFKAWICPIFHPSYILRQRKMTSGKQCSPAEFYFKQDIASALDLLDVEVPDYGDPLKHVQIVPANIAKEVLAELLNGEERRIAFDYETTGLKPHDPKHFVISASICFESDKAYAFSMDTGDEELEDIWVEFLQAKHLLKVGANIKYEETWGRFCYDVETASWDFDTTLGAHILDNRSGITSLKFQTYIRFGFAGYEDEVGQYIKSKGSNAMNKLHKAPRKKVLLYNGLDSLFTYRMAEEMIEEIWG